MNKARVSTPSLSEVHSTVEIPKEGKLWRKLLAFFGPAYLVCVGYMDPGNWATDIAGGSQFGYSLIWVLLMSNIMALLLQSLSARLGIVRGRDLAQSSRENYPPFVNFILWILAEIAIAATDLAEVLGMAIGLQLLFGIPLIVGVSITVLDTFIILFLQSYGMRKMEAFILGLVAIIGMSFFAEMIFAKPDIGELSRGFIPYIPSDEALYIAIGIIGATVMPHNLYLHSALVQTRKIERTPKGLWTAIKFNFFDSAIALNLAFLVNSAILVLAASAFYRNGMFDVTELKDAHEFLAPMLGTQWASILFAVALIAAGQSSTITGTLSGQIVMEGYLNLRIQPWLRRLITRLIAIIPALVTIIIFGEGYTSRLLVLSQVILSLQLGFAIIPLIHFVSDKEKMGEFVIKNEIKTMAWLSALIIVTLNVKLVFEQIAGWIASAGDNAWVFWLTVVPVAVGAIFLLLYITFKPFAKRMEKFKMPVPHGMVHEIGKLSTPQYKRIAITIDFSDADVQSINHAIAQGGKDAEYVLIHIVESAGAMMMGSEIEDFETESDNSNLNEYMNDLRQKGYNVVCKLGYGNPKKTIPDIVNVFKADLLVMGAHGHRALKDIIFGTTVEAVRHGVKIPVLVVRKEP